MAIQTGQRVRITLLKDVIGYDPHAAPLHTPDLIPIGPRAYVSAAPLELPIKVYATAGTIYEGSITDLDEAGFFDLNMDDGTALGFYAADPAITIEVLDQ